jgi:NADPH:quinone reductase-like Zn-dependent oxidoreductase
VNTNRALLLTDYGGPEAAKLSLIAQPQPGPGQVRVRVRAAGLNGLDWKVREGYVRDAYPIQLPAVLGIERAGAVDAVGQGATRFKVGDRVMCLLGGLAGLGGLGGQPACAACGSR